MEDRGWLVERFEAHRPHLRSVAYRMLGSAGEAVLAEGVGLALLVVLDT